MAFIRTALAAATVGVILLPDSPAGADMSGFRTLAKASIVQGVVAAQPALPRAASVPVLRRLPRHADGVRSSS